MLVLCFAGGITFGAGGIHGGQEMYGHPSRIRETSLSPELLPPEQPGGPVGHYLGSPFGTLHPSLDPHNSIWGLLCLAPLAQWCQPNLEDQIFNSECTHWAVSHWKTQSQMWWRNLHCVLMPQQWVTALDSTPQGVHKHSWVLPTPREMLICTLPPRWESNRNSLRHWSLMRQTKKKKS